MGKKYCILNKQYSPQDYEEIVEKILVKIRAESLDGKFFPGKFGANPYDESLSGYWWPLSAEEQERRGFRVKTTTERKNENYRSPESIPDISTEAMEAICADIFWDEASKRPFQITKKDLRFCQAQNIPLPYFHYLKRVKENFSWVFFIGELRETVCAQTGQKVTTSLPPSLDGRIVSREAYLELVY